MTNQIIINDNGCTTCSSHTFDSSVSTTFVPVANATSVIYNNSTLTATQNTDTMCLNSLSTSCVFSVSFAETSDKLDSVANGVIGFGLGTPSYVDENKKSSKKDNSTNSESWIDTFMTAGLLTAPYMGLELMNAPDDSFIDYGVFNEASYSKSVITWFGSKWWPINSKKQTHWKQPVEGIAIQNTSYSVK